MGSRTSTTATSGACRDTALRPGNAVAGRGAGHPAELHPLRCGQEAPEDQDHLPLPAVRGRQPGVNDLLDHHCLLPVDGLFGGPFFGARASCQRPAETVNHTTRNLLTFRPDLADVHVERRLSLSRLHKVGALLVRFSPLRHPYRGCAVADTSEEFNDNYICRLAQGLSSAL